MQNQPQSSTQFCAQCGSALQPNAQFCSNCGKSTELSPNPEVVSSPSPQIQVQKSKLMWVVWGVIALFLYGIVSPVMKRSAISSREHEQRLEEANRRVASSEKEMQKSIDDMKNIVESSRSVPKLEVQSWKKGRKSDSYIEIVGEVKNISTYSLDGIKALVSFYDKKGDLVNANDALIDFQPILPGQISPFKVIATYDPAMDKANIAFKESDGGTIASTVKDKEE